MSVNFWVDLLIAILAFLCAIVFVHQYKHGLIRNFRAKRFRRKLVSKLQELVPIATGTFTGSQPDLMYLFRIRADIEELLLQGSVLFNEERKALADFMAMLSAVTVKYETGLATPNNIEDVVLVGQRTINELTEIGY